jgi:hypothetical protein
LVGDPSNVINLLRKTNFETFNVYKFAIDYPNVCRVEFNPKSRRESGDLVFHFPDKEKVFITWGQLEEAQKRFHTIEEHAEHGIKTVSKTSSIKGTERIKKDMIEVNSHKALYNHVRLNQASPGLFAGGKTTPHDLCSVHIHCDRSSRYFVIYALLSANAPKDFDELMKIMVESFNCH